MSTATIARPTLKRPKQVADIGRIIVRESRQRRVRSIRQFAEDEIIVQHGSKAIPFRVKTQPFSGVVFDEIDSGNWYEIYLTGPSQTAKTTVAHLIPAAHTICEHRENLVLGIPLDEMVDDKIRGDLFKMFERSPRLKGFLPDNWRGGRIKEKVTFSHGIEAKPMTRNSGDVGKAGYPARVVCVTEAADWSQASESSPEADPLRQLKARMKSFPRAMRRLIVEGTTTNELELPWRARGKENDDTIISSMTRLVVPCPHCSEWIEPDREHLKGWQNAQTEDEAANESHYICPKCDAKISDDERRKAQQHVKGLHFGQSIDANGDVQGAVPPTHTLFLRWTAWHNCLLSIADVAVEEWKAAQIEEGTEDRENAEKELCQFTFCRPFESTLTRSENLDPKIIRTRGVKDWQKNLLPHDTKYLTIGVDLGKWTGWWFAIAFREGGQLHVVAYGAFDICRDENDDIGTRIIHALTEFNDSVVESGFAVEGSDGMRLPDAVWVDMNYHPDDVAAFVRTKGRGFSNRWMACRGRGKSVPGNNGGYHHPKAISQAYPKIGTQWYAEFNFKRRIPEVTLNSDYWILHMQDRLRGDVGRKGSMSFYRADSKNEHAKVSNHLVADKLNREWDPKKGGLVEKWSCSGDNHWGDGAKIACAAADSLGYKLREVEEVVDEWVVAEPARKATWWSE